VTARLRVDWSVCDGHGLCSVLAPEVISLDPWGFPVVADGPLSIQAARHVAVAVNACPVLALKLLPR
jgi:ferredoxin